MMATTTTASNNPHALTAKTRDIKALYGGGTAHTPEGQPA